MAKKKWIQSVVKKMDKGAFSSKAKRAGLTTAQYAKKVLAPGSRASAKTKKQASLARTFSKMRKK